MTFPLINAATKVALPRNHGSAKLRITPILSLPPPPPSTVAPAVAERIS